MARFALCSPSALNLPYHVVRFLRFRPTTYLVGGTCQHLWPSSSPRTLDWTSKTSGAQQTRDGPGRVSKTSIL
ncbi:hypothetical protein BDQ94DRAFT_151672, partial [Aspergillus welwitschiae]